MSSSRDIAPPEFTAADRAIGLRPLTARSLLASMLLGSHPPRLPVRVLVAAAGLFGITDGSARTALSRMVAAGDIRMNDGWYELEADLLARQRRQDRGRSGEPEVHWNGQWHTAIVTADRRPATERAYSRTVLTEAHLAELREGVWIRPETSELTSPLLDLGEHGWIFGTTTFRRLPDPAELWDLAGWMKRAHGLNDAIDDLLPALEAGNRSSLPRGFLVAAAGLRLFRDDPRLPRELLPQGWPRADFQERYDRFDRSYRRVLKAFFDETR